MEDKIEIKADANWNISFGAINSRVEKSSIEILKKKKLILLNIMVFILLGNIIFISFFGLLSLIKPTKLDIMDFYAKQ